MITRCFLALTMLGLATSSLNAASLWHSVVLDSFNTDTITNVKAAGTATAAGLPNVGGTDAALTADSVTGRRDLAVFRDGSFNTAEYIDANVAGQQYKLEVVSSANGAARIQNDYGVNYGATSTEALTSALDLTGASQIDVIPSTSEVITGYIIDVAAGTDAGFDVTFTVWGDNDADYATSSVQTTTGGAEKLRFDLADFTDKNGLFATNVASGKEYFTWSNVYAYTISLSSGSSNFTGNFIANSVYGTVPEPCSMLALAGLFGSVGVVGLRRRRKSKKA